MAMEMAGDKALGALVDSAASRTNLGSLANKVMALQTADKFRLAAMLLDVGISDLAETVGKRAVDELRLSALLAGK